MASTSAEVSSQGLSNLSDTEIQLLSEQTGINDLEELSKHLIQVQAEAYAVVPHTCIRCFDFAKQKISRLPIYSEVLKLGRQRPGALFLEVGCGCASDSRKIVADGWPVRQVIASDLHAEFWDIGHETFKTTPQTFPAKFLAGDVTDPAFLAPGPAATINGEPPVLDELTSLTPLQGRLSAIYAYSFFHLFDEAQHRRIATGLASLLSAEPGSVIFGAQLGHQEKSEQTEVRANGQAVPTFRHSPESWVQLWNEVFGADRVRVGAQLVEKDFMRHAVGTTEGKKYWYLEWSVTMI